MTVIPLWTSHYSIGTSILTLDESSQNKTVKQEPRSIIQLCIDNNINPLFLVENNMSGFVKAFKNSKDSNLKLHFGLKLVVCSDSTDKSPASLKTEHKVIIFARNSNGYKRLLKIYSEAATHGFYYRPRIDVKSLESFWSKKDLLLAHPFYFSFLHRNLLYFSNCQPNFNFADNIFFIERNDLPFNYLIEDAIKRFCNGRDIKVNTQTIYYEKPEDFKTFLTYKAINKRTTLDMPNIEHCASNQFNLEYWKELTKHENS